MTRAPSPPPRATWQQWGTPNLGPEADDIPLSAAQPTVHPEALRRALLAEEQRQVFALLSRLRQARKG